MSNASAQQSASGAAGGNARTRAQTASLVIGVIFLLVGVLGFVPGITSHYGEMKFASHESGALLLGIFQVSILHNIVHLLFGIFGLVLARAHHTARLYLIIGGVIYLILWIYGLVVDHDSMANFVPLNTADNWLHLILGIGMVALGFILGRDSSTTNRPATR